VGPADKITHIGMTLPIQSSDSSGMPRPKLTRPSEVRSWISAQQFLPSKVLGQNFLIDENILRIMLDTAELSETDHVLEIGPGLGILTEPMMDKAGQVVAIEKDKRLAAHLTDAYTSRENFTLITNDALQVNFNELKDRHRLNKLVSNLPYSVGSRLLVEAFMMTAGFDLMVVTVQLEVGQRLAANVNTSDYGLLSIWAQLDYDARVIKHISPACFFPRPQVTSAIVLLRKTHRRRAALKNIPLFDALIKHAFSRRRKQMGTIMDSFHFPGNINGSDALLVESGIEPTRRPETITPNEWIKLADVLNGH